MTSLTDPQDRTDSRSRTAPDDDQGQGSSVADPLPDERWKRRFGLSGHNPYAGSMKSSAADRLWDAQGLLWFAFAFAAGIGVYVWLPEEPSWLLMTGLAVFAGLAVWRVGQGGKVAVPAILCLAFFAGLATSSLRTAYVSTPRLAEPMNADVSGVVEEVDTGAAGVRLVLAVTAVNERPVEALVFPAKVRVRIPADSAVEVGDTVRINARLFPPAGPVFPGGYDYSFRAFFQQIGATGFSFGPPQVIKVPDQGIGLRPSVVIAKLRSNIAERIKSSLADGPETALIVALLVGDRSGIAEEQEEVLRSAGLAHILAISGLHMALFAGGAYGAVLLLLSLIPVLTLRWPVHKWAALSALGAAVVYLLLSGGAVATQRSFLMIAIVFLGVLVGRRGLTLRSVALAGLLLLVIAPERLFFPGFQMSFAAVICLVAVYDLWRQRDRFGSTGDRVSGWGMATCVFLGKWVAGLLVTALVAGLATGIIGAHHFSRIAPYGVVGNLLGMPVFSLLVMPMGVMAFVLMPFGLAALPLAVMSIGVSLLLKVASFTAALDAGGGASGRLDGMAASLLLSALFAGLLLPGRRRLLAGFPLLAGLMIVITDQPPDIQIAASGSRIAARDETGALRYEARGRSFATDLWLQSEGVPDEAILSRKMKSPQKMCDDDGCVVRAYGPGESEEALQLALPYLAIAQPKTFEAFQMDCRYADLIVTDLVAPENCSSVLVLDQETRSARGAVSIWLSASAARRGDDTNRLGDREVLPPDGKPKIEKLVYAIPDPPRPWHRPGTVTRDGLRQASRASFAKERVDE
ncbi:ComEC/Rec2 family competence protein [Roseibium sp. FZY0029]|uniref:ComEC/Rec2 family competence protein n=1 Tax=Roseibium sp. FZY0029 TaxID=3116647 RepID=UPI002EA9B724|nr:ComEC/Rec2 family competence protein [Roseibium sp. FZY0029]